MQQLDYYSFLSFKNSTHQAVSSMKIPSLSNCINSSPPAGHNASAQFICTAKQQHNRVKYTSVHVYMPANHLTFTF